MKKTTVTLPDDLYWRWEEEIPRRRMNRRDSMIEALENWLSNANAGSSVVLVPHPTVEGELQARRSTAEDGPEKIVEEIVEGTRQSETLEAPRRRKRRSIRPREQKTG